MSRYKDVDEILEEMDTWPKYGCKPDGRFIKLTKETEADYVPYVHYDDMVQAVTGTPVQDVAPVVHARFKPYPENIFREGQNMKCTNCGKLFKVEYLNYLFWDYCPHCGALMDGGNNDG